VTSTTWFILYKRHTYQIVGDQRVRDLRRWWPLGTHRHSQTDLKSLGIHCPPDNHLEKIVNCIHAPQFNNLNSPIPPSTASRFDNLRCIFSFPFPPSPPRRLPFGVLPPPLLQLSKTHAFLTERAIPRIRMRTLQSRLCRRGRRRFFRIRRVPVVVEAVVWCRGVFCGFILVGRFAWERPLEYGLPLTLAPPSFTSRSGKIMTKRQKRKLNPCKVTSPPSIPDTVT